MNQIFKSVWTLAVFIVFLQLCLVYSQPSSPQNISITATINTLIVRWERPVTYFGDIRYILAYSVFPVVNETLIQFNMQDIIPFALIPTKNQEGRLYLVRVRAQDRSGLGPYSRPRYYRIKCGYDAILNPGEQTTLESPGFRNSAFKAGVVCKWSLTTNNTHSLHFVFDTLRIESDKTKLCTYNYIEISNIGTFCHRRREHKDLDERVSHMTVVFRSGRRPVGQGFRLVVRSAVKPPTAPTNITMAVSPTRQALLLSWKPPIGTTLPISAYVIKYTILPDGFSLKILVGASMRHFAINTVGYEGKLFMTNITAKVLDIEGKTSKPVYIKAPCGKDIRLEADEVINITSPRYPQTYPKGIICYWNITSRPEVTFQVTILYLQVQSEIGSDVYCSNDFLSLTVDGDVHRLCEGKELLRLFRTSVPKLDVKFVSDVYEEYRGFVLEIRAKGPPTTAALTTTESTSFAVSSSALQTITDSPVITGATNKGPVTSNLGWTTFSIDKFSSKQFTANETMKPSVMPEQISTQKPVFLSSTISFVPEQTNTMRTHYTNTINDTAQRTKIRVTSTVSSLSSTETLLTRTNNRYSESPVSSHNSTGKVPLSILSTFGSTISSFRWTPASSTGIPSSIQVVRNGTKEYFEPDLSRKVFTVAIWLKINNTRNSTKRALINADGMEQILQKVEDVFRSSEMFIGLSVIQRPNKSLVLFHAKYSVQLVLLEMRRNSSFDLISFINETIFSTLISTPVKTDHARLDTAFIQNFRSSKNFETQRICDICATLEQTYTGLCHNEENTGQDQGNFTCRKCHSTKTGIVCIRDLYIERNTSSQAGDGVEVPIISAVAGVMVMIGIGIFYFHWKRQRRKCKVYVKNFKRNGHIEFHDILLQTKYIGDRDVEMTLFKWVPTRKPPLRRFSFPRYSDVRKQKVSDEVEAAMKRFGSFIEDKDTLRKRLQLKHRLRRSQSV